MFISRLDLDLDLQKALSTVCSRDLTFFEAVSLCRAVQGVALPGNLLALLSHCR